jgi:hypothetical protein
VKKGYIVASLAQRCRRDLQQGQSHQLQLAGWYLLAAARSRKFEIMHLRSPEPSPHPRQHFHHIFAAQSGTSPEIPAPGIASEISNFDVAMGGRFLRAAFPARYCHRGGLQPLAERSLIQV